MTADTATAANSITVIITTSVTPSAPSTDLISAVLESFRKHCPALLDCRVIVVFDAFDQIGPVARLKKGTVTAQQAHDFSAYKENIKSLLLDQYFPGNEGFVLTETEGEAEYGSPCNPQNVVNYKMTEANHQKVTFIEPSRRLGFGLAVRSALRITDTPYVWIQQHDWILSSKLPIDALLQVMRASEHDPDVPIKYICLPAVRMLCYATSADVAEFPALRALTSSMKRTFTPPSQPDVGVPLTPLFFWHDKPHIASTSHYLSSVFPTRLSVLRGDFIEDKVGQRARGQMKEGEWKKWATWLYYPDEGKQRCLRHLQGRTWEGVEREAEKAVRWRQHQEKKADQLVTVSPVDFPDQPERETADASTEPEPHQSDGAADWSFSSHPIVSTPNPN